jgi:hypothetical protein
MSFRRAVLVVGMFDSIHFARWLKQFESENIDFFVFPSRKYRYVNYELKTLLKSNSAAKFIPAAKIHSTIFSGILDFLCFELLSKIFSKLKRECCLQSVLLNKNYTHIHALEIQGAGYLLAKIPKALMHYSKVIVTNWGSDIYYFKKFPDHQRQIKVVLSLADYYSAECNRDYALARELGFSGVELPCIPNAGGFIVDKYRNGAIQPSQRYQVSIKGYGGEFGRADIPILLIPHLLIEFPNINFFIYSATKDIVRMVNRLPKNLKKRIRVSSVRNRLPHESLINELLNSRVYIGCSKSDGISTSFMEALITGAYPIQTNTSCASDWIARGAVGSIIPVSEIEMYNSIRQALHDNVLVNSAAELNLQVARNYLDYELIKKSALVFYR